jgi:hypothetical protein
MRKLLFVCAALLIAAAYAPAFAQPAGYASEDGFIPNLNVDPDMAASGKNKSPFVFSYGGWVTPVLIDTKSGSADDSGSAIITTKLWMQMTLWPDAFIYVRGKDDYLIPGSIAKKQFNKDLDDNVYDLDMGYINMTFASGALRIAAGRKYYVIGTGLVMNGRADGGEVDIFTNIVDLKAFGAYTGYLKKDNNPYGLSSKDLSDGSKRVFAGGTIERTFANQTLYLLGLMQMDKGSEDASQKSRYQSQYYGGGLKGVLADGLDYYAEFIYEMGESYIGTTNEKADVKAMAWMLGINYYFDAAFNPAILFQYAYGSGDKDRTDAKGPTANASGDDNGFITFGTYQGGYALRPTLANLHIARLGGSFVPLYAASSPTMRRINFLFYYTYYMKDEAKGTINSGEAPNNSTDVGQGLDAAIRWGILHDLAFFVNYAAFIPGKAYVSSEPTRHFVMAGFNLSF